MSEQYQHNPTIPTREFSSPERREQIEVNLKTPLGAYAHEFDASHYSSLLGADTLGEGVLNAMRNEIKLNSGEDAGFRVICQPNFDNPDGTFSGGFLFFGASSREVAERNQDVFTRRMNVTLEQLDAGFRLDEPNPFAGGELS